MEHRSDGMARIRVRLARDEQGWPPAESEGLWANDLGDGRYRLANTPWFAFSLSADDVVSARSDGNDVLWFAERLERGGRMTVRVIPRNDGPLEGDPGRVLEVFSPLGVTGEVMGGPMRLVALDIGPDADVGKVKRVCVGGESNGWWDYEEADITSDWRATSPG